MTDFGIDNIDRLEWLLLAVVCGLVTIYGFVQKGRALRRFASANLVGLLTPDVSPSRQVVRAALVLTAMVAIVLALIGPRWGRFFAEVHKKNLDMIICLDVSRSMLAEDAGMSRLDRAKDDVKQLLDVMSGGMVGLVTFAGGAELSCPLTDDFEFLRLTLDDVGIHSAPLGGTNLGEAIDTGVDAFADLGRRHRVILLLTDGEDHGQRGAAAAAKARDQGIDVYAIGIGDADRGGLVPVNKSGQQSYLMHEGQQVWSRLDPRTLDAVAESGGTGQYYPSGQINARQRTLEWIYAEKIAPEMQRTKSDRRAEQLYPRFHWLAAIALGLLLLESVISERRSAGAKRRGAEYV